ncbi:MAG: type IV toxin-antitoxin system AbiEi family antitoxin [Kiritimatiellae bacterium]|nr:type IV toxin-antitoxin system AbiEi family antitoxin [Kiritimatiellia bacterium]
MKRSSESLSELVDAYQRQGRYVISSMEAREALRPKKEASLRKAFQRLCAQGRLMSPRRGFYVIIPLEYATAGTPPAEWFIDDLMRFLGLSYYVGGLSAAAMYGAAHQRVQELQVVVPVHQRLIETPVLRIRFLQNRSMDAALTQTRRTHTGDIPVSTPEWTALDLIRFQHQYGGLDAAATVLTELAEELDAERLGEASRRESCNAYIQRLGWMLDYLGKKELTSALQGVLEKRNPSFVPLSASLKERIGPRDERWKVWVNEEPGGDL